jgi:putative tricarboxylic transport membrane protein
VHSDPIDPGPDRVEVAVAAGVVSLGLLVLGGAFAVGFGVGYDRIGPRFFPFLVAAGLLVSGSILLREAFRRNNTRDLRAQSWWHVGVVTIALVLAVVALEGAGFILTSLAVFWLVARAFGSHQPGRDASVGVLLSVIIYFAFTRGLGLPLPAGFFEWLF